MAQQLIDVGTVADDGTGDSGRVGGIKVNDNFTELYSLISDDLPLAGGVMTGAITVADLVNAITGGDYAIQMDSGITDGASAIGYLLDTVNDLDTFGAITHKFASGGKNIMSLSHLAVSGGSDFSMIDTSDGGSDLTSPTKIKAHGLLGGHQLVNGVGSIIELDPFNGRLATSLAAGWTIDVNGTDVLKINAVGAISSLVVGATVGLSGTRFTGMYTALLSGGSDTSGLKVLAAGIGTGGLQLQDQTTDYIGFYGITPIQQPAALTAPLTQITHTAPGTPDYAFADTVDSGAGSAWGFSTHDEANTVLSVILNLQTRVDELEAALDSTTGLGVIG